MTGFALPESLRECKPYMDDGLRQLLKLSGEGSRIL